MRRAIPLGLAFIAATALAREPRPISSEDRWIDALNAAQKELAACQQLGVEAKLYGDVTVAFDRKHRRWTRTSSRSLDAIGVKAAACVQDAIARHFHDDPSDEGSWDDTLRHMQTIGTPVVVLPAVARLLPVWRRARTDAKARGELAKLLPPDYKVSADGCFRTDRDAIENVEYLWLPTAGTWVPRLWDKTLAAALGDKVSVAMWRAPGEFVTKSGRGLCLVAFDAAKQAALRAEMDKLATCLAGGFDDVLLHPRVAMPAGSYTQVSTQNGRACALSTAGEITCCGPTESGLPPPPKGPFTQVATGGKFGCALDAKGAATCWGPIAAPPAGPFTKLSAEYQHVCGVRASGELVCWGAGNYDVAQAPGGKFTDVSAAQFSTCGLHTDGTIECWGLPSRGTHPAGAFAQIAAEWTHACGLRRDGTLGCWRDNQVDTPLPGTFTQVAVGDIFEACMLAKDGTLACTPATSKDAVTPPPSGTFTQLAGDHQMFCAVATDHRVACWGEPWPGSWAGDNTWPYAKVLGLAPSPPPPAPVPAKPGMIAMSGRIVDEHDRPIANAEVLACAASGGCVGADRPLRWKPTTLAAVTAGWKVPSDAIAIVKTGSDGRWTAYVKRPPDAHWGDRLGYVAVAPGREVQIRESSNAADLTGDLTLRPAATVDIDARCGGAACPAPLRVGLSPYEWSDGTHIERLPPGSHQIEVASGFGEPGERRAFATVTVTFAGGAQHVTAALTPVGTGQTITGVAELDGSPKPRLLVSARCDRAAGWPIFRKAETDAHGNFELHDVGAAPCDIDASGPDAIGSTKVDKVPADHVRVRAVTQPDPRFEE